MKKVTPKKERTVLSLDPRLKARLQEMANRNGVNVSAYVSMALSGHLKAVDKLEGRVAREDLK